MNAEKAAQEAISRISAMQTLVDNFPQSILSLARGKHYTSVIAFIIDVLKMCQVDVDDITNKIILKIFASKGGQRAQEMAEKIKTAISRVQYASSPEAAFLALSDLPDESDTITKMEDVLKITLGEMLAALLSCNCIPVIPDDKMDKIAGKNTYGFMSIPVDYIDMFGKLDLCPTTTTGMCYYQLDTEYVYREVERYAIPSLSIKEYGLDDDSKAEWKNEPVAGPNAPKYVRYISKRKNIDKYYRLSRKSVLASSDLWKSTDLDAFIWYTLNRGANTPQMELNKTMWDNRLNVKSRINQQTIDTTTKEGKHLAGALRPTSNDWNYWVYSKENENDVLEYSGCQTTYKDSPLYPIMQLEREEYYEDVDRLRVYLSAQRYANSPIGSSNTGATDYSYASPFNALIPNHTMYKFNADYLRSIKVFNFQSILAGFLKILYGGQFGMSLSLQGSLIEKKIKNIVANIVEADDLDVENCYYTFSNEDYELMLNNYEKSKYFPQTNTDNELIDTINTVNNSASVAGSISTIKKSVYDASVTETSSDKLSLNFSVNGEDYLTAIINALMMPLVEAILTPKVILLILINFEISGLIKFEELTSMSKDELIDFLLKKVMALLSQIIVMIKDMIVQMLMELVMEFIVPIIQQFISVVLVEKLNMYIKFLEEVLECIPVFDFNFKKYNTTIDEVNYADIQKDQNEPDATAKSC